VQRKWASFDTSLGRWQVPLVHVEGDDLDGTGFPLLLTLPLHITVLVISQERSLLGGERGSSPLIDLFLPLPY
jgi:hypothetical protein